MKRFSQAFISWWGLNIVPVRTPMRTLAEREYERKRRLLGAILFLASILALLSTTIGTLTTPLRDDIPGWSECFLLLLALWLNRRGSLIWASLTLFLSGGAALFLGAHIASLSLPVILLWELMPIAAILALAGLFLPAWVIGLMAVGEGGFLFWYIVTQRQAELTRIVSPIGFSRFLIYLFLMMFLNAVIGIFYTLTTKKAIMQADRATELELAHQELSRAYASLEEAHATIQKQALTDGLTGLPNHRAVVDQLAKELERARRYNRPFSVLFFDADRFKQVNDTHGHGAGDAVLCEIGKRISSVLRGGDTLGRFGGEEYVLLLPEANTKEARAIAERIREVVAAGPMATSEVVGGIAMTVSIGVATYPDDACSEQELLTRADEAMYVAKRLGRNQVRTAEEAKKMSADLELMTLMQVQGRIDAAEREKLSVEQLKETYTVKMICSLMSLLERRDKGLSQHCYAVRDLSLALAQALNVEPAQVTQIGMAALLHDIGKIAIPDMLLKKSGELSSHEYALLHEHAELGAHILEASPFLHDLIAAVRHHHERWDGGGYPDKLTGEDIPLAARIIAVAEAYDTMVTPLSYKRELWTSEEAVRELSKCAGKQFDPAIVQLLPDVLANRQTAQPLSLV